MQRMTREERFQCVFYHRNGAAAVQTSRILETSSQNVYRAIKRFQDTGNYEDRERSGRPRISNPRDDRLIFRTSLSNRKDSVPELRTEWIQNGVVASNTTVRRRLHNAGLKGCVAVKKTTFDCYPSSEKIDICTEPCKLDIGGQFMFYGLMSLGSQFFKQMAGRM
ncbi:uncharacterized protein LOC110461608 [Mizuhopecten yessoensis]|uniref:uncharacterized protein LOC110461608 n=1 Tax=Mizuhopecten yessoensis TaxID=6573 RepID=UPI000B45CFE4|nr:uncharacterized protein LOC110461608 [Mizuhopecten yessoensis]